MIVYQATKSQFCTDVLDDVIEERIVEQFAHKLKRKVARAEVTAYKNSMAYMDRVINHSDIPGNSVQSDQCFSSQSDQSFRLKVTTHFAAK